MFPGNCVSSMPLIIPIFIPHQGCPQQCLFCNQVSISGQHGLKDDAELVPKIIREWLERNRKHREVQVAFYGGSFTCLPERRQQVFLAAVQPFIQSGKIVSIRLSTRPDCVDEKKCDFLKEYGVQTVELGVQSLDDKVLQAAHRGHTREDSIRAAAIIKESGIHLGIQLMPGLPLESSRSWAETVKQAVKLKPDCVRLYPTLVVAGSGLAEQYREGKFQPMSMNRAIAYCCKAKERFDKAGIKVLRMGLQPSASLEKSLLAGPYHPSFGELVASRNWFRKARKVLAECPAETTVTVKIADRDISAFVGLKKINMKRLQELEKRENKKLILERDTTITRGTLKYAFA
jgi:histone acetyltransferase (RNA polymerase elongator complex component)